MLARWTLDQTVRAQTLAGDIYVICRLGGPYGPTLSRQITCLFFSCS